MHYVMYWALAGFLVPVAILILTQLQGGIFAWPRLAVTLWPSSIILMGIHGLELTALEILIFAISIGINVLLYSAVGALFWWIFSRTPK